MKQLLTIGSGLLLSALTWSGASFAAPPIQGLALGVERVFGVSSTSIENEANNTEVTSTRFSLGSTPESAAAYSGPRVGIDYVLPMGLSFGGAFGVGVTNQSNQVNSGVGSVSTDSDTTTLLFTPRVGYLVGFNEKFGVWPRAGFSLVTSSITSGDNDVSASYGALSFEAPFVFTPNVPFGFVATPALDFGVTGSIESGDQKVDITATEFSLTFGLFVVL